MTDIPCDKGRVSKFAVILSFVQGFFKVLYHQQISMDSAHIKTEFFSGHTLFKSESILENDFRKYKFERNEKNILKYMDF